MVINWVHGESRLATKDFQKIAELISLNMYSNYYSVQPISLFSWTCALMCDCDAPGGENMNYIAATEILPKAYLAKSGPDICYFRSSNPEFQQRSTPIQKNKINKLHN